MWVEVWPLLLSKCLQSNLKPKFTGREIRVKNRLQIGHAWFWGASLWGAWLLLSSGPSVHGRLLWVWALWQSWRLNVPRATDCPRRARYGLSILDVGAGTLGAHRCVCACPGEPPTARANGGALCPQSPGPQVRRAPGKGWDLAGQQAGATAWARGPCNWEGQSGGIAPGSSRPSARGACPAGLGAWSGAPGPLPQAWPFPAADRLHREPFQAGVFLHVVWGRCVHIPGGIFSEPPLPPVKGLRGDPGDASANRDQFLESCQLSVTDQEKVWTGFEQEGDWISNKNNFPWRKAQAQKVSLMDCTQHLRRIQTDFQKKRREHFPLILWD